MTDDNDEKPRRAKAKGDDETMTSAQFREWVADAGYPRIEPAGERKGKRAERPVQRKIPYDATQIALDLGVTRRRIYDYWSGHSSDGRTVNPPPTVALLCRELLRTRRLEQRIEAAETELSRFKAAAKVLLARDE
jgi:hypothetical protein